MLSKEVSSTIFKVFGMTPKPLFPSMTWIVLQLFFSKDGFGIKKKSREVLYALKQRNQTESEKIYICIESKETI